MIQPLRARYGVKNNSHGLLEWQGEPTTLPSELLGLTDKPPGHLVPGERWWPSLGCGTVGDWWALWWTMPDESAYRAGMVSSEVALWRSGEIGAVDDLRPVLASLSGIKAIPSSLPEQLHSVAEALLSSEVERSPVFSDLDAWPGILADIWSRLWPEARRNFSARVAVIPPQGGESSAPPLLYCVTRQSLPAWANFPVIRFSSDSPSINRAASWLIGEGDSTFKEILDSCHFCSGELKALDTVARAADRLDKLREYPTPNSALEFLRTLSVLASSHDEAINLKTEALKALVIDLKGEKLEFVLKLRNFSLVFLASDASLPDSLTRWVHSQSPYLTPDEARQLLTSLEENKAEAWWQMSVRQALLKGFANPDKHWAKSALNWLGFPDCTMILKAILPSSEIVETCLLDVVDEISLSETALRQIETQAESRLWSRLHAWVVINLYSPSKAFQLQRKFPGNAVDGLKYLVAHLSGGDIINEVISTPDSQLVQLVVQRTVREPQLLKDLNAGKAVWRDLWAAHIAAGGVCWPPNVNREIQGLKLLDAVTMGEKESSGLIALLAKDLSEIVFNYPDRPKLWNQLNPNSCSALLPLVAEVLIQTCNAGQVVSSPEPQLAQEVLKRTRTIGHSIKVFVVLFSSSVSPDEQDLIQCISSSTRTDWQPGITKIIGKAVSERRWKKAAEKSYDRFMSGAIPELQSVVETSLELFTWLQRLKFGIKTGNRGISSVDEDNLVSRVADLGGDLAPEELDDIWERAGGKRKDLKTGVTPAIRWQSAAKLAENGKLKNGLLALVNELQNTHPHNPELKELAGIISEMKNR
ncbi:effector-associated domain EAD1-containing protein (plasmid) [Methylomonas sp. MS20]|uniref:GAP1-N1 domain-containing protein n=1 Tax=Methylomonas sp. MS20 TaxID=3418769 RepID=UPI003CFED75A